MIVWARVFMDVCMYMYVSAEPIVLRDKDVYNKDMLGTYDTLVLLLLTFFTVQQSQSK